MKKFLVTLLLLIILGSAAFFYGWAQFSVPPGFYGVVFSKTHGVDSEPVREGEFRWIWYKLIPTNVKIAVFKLENLKFPIEFNSALPSGNNYASFAGLSNADFSWDLRGEISFSLDPESLVQLTSSLNITDQEELDAFFNDTAKYIEILILRTLSSSDTDNMRIENILSGNRDIEMEREIAAHFPEIRDFSLRIQSAKYPDFILYRQIRQLYEEFMESQREYISTAFGRRAESHIESRLHFEELERYGELLTKYPILLEYMAMERNSGGNR
jgi:hypothetical protein